MRGFWSVKNWRLDGDALLMPNGQRLSLKDIREWREDLYAGNADLTGPEAACGKTGSRNTSGA